ncbi:MAG: sigma-54-dependent transcriptional regulator [Porticoccaceae bacterium]
MRSKNQIEKLLCQHLIVEDSMSAAKLYDIYLDAIGLKVEIAHSAAEAMLKYQSRDFEIVLLDIELPDGCGLAMIDDLLEQGKDTKIIVTTALDSAYAAIEAIRKGVFEFLVKPFDAARLHSVVEKALENRFVINSGNRRSKFIGISDSMQAVYRMIDSAATSDVSVFITGESGTGKEIAAWSIHEQSKRAKERFHAIKLRSYSHRTVGK